MKVICVVGTRPEAIKMAPIILAMGRDTRFQATVLATAQHREMLDQVLDFFSITPDIDLNVMRENQSLAELTARLLIELDRVLKEEKPDAVIIQGDTTTVMTMALACYYNDIPIGHVEAGLRTWDIKNPFPEEANRVITSKFAKWHFAPTKRSSDNLIKEGVSKSDITITGNTVIDALHVAAGLSDDIGLELDPTKPLVLITAHRRENFGDPLVEIFRAILELSKRNPEYQFLYPVHPNPNVSRIANQMLKDVDAITLCPPLEYPQFVAAMKRAHFIISDSGGIQEEAPALGKPVVVLRDETERPEAAEMGLVELVGTKREKIVACAQKLITDRKYYDSMAQGASPYGDGMASNRIVSVLATYRASKLNQPLLHD